MGGTGSPWSTGTPGVRGSHPGVATCTASGSPVETPGVAVDGVVVGGAVVGRVVVGGVASTKFRISKSYVGCAKGCHFDL